MQRILEEMKKSALVPASIGCIAVRERRCMIHDSLALFLILSLPRQTNILVQELRLSLFFSVAASSSLSSAIFLSYLLMNLYLMDCSLILQSSLSFATFSILGRSLLRGGKGRIRNRICWLFCLLLLLRTRLL